MVWEWRGSLRESWTLLQGFEGGRGCWQFQGEKPVGAGPFASISTVTPVERCASVQGEGEREHQALGEAGAANNLLRDARQSRVRESANIRHWVRQEQLTTC